DPEEMVTRHLLDSLAVLPLIEGASLLDAGSGAGLPGVPLALAKPDLRVTLLDSGGKKARFLRHVQRQLNLENVDVVGARAEVFQPPVLADTVISRAFGGLAEFLRATAKLGAERGQWLAMKGKLDDQELENIPKEYRVRQIIPLKVPGLNEERHLVCVSRLTLPASRLP
ncbi:MAG: 16S rRNA (guanine(527)-N(7))-methyltransferase RsmG, partial [Hydrocarboniphaga effusa]|nr:16S rRNA (guanine(527)-N(7))-methyltransferase RsmG [Hydrocarboniphaga effusa]